MMKNGLAIINTKTLFFVRSQTPVRSYPLLRYTRDCVCVYYCTTAKYKFYYKTLLIAWPNLLEVNKVCFSKTVVLILSLREKNNYLRFLPKFYHRIIASQGFQIREDFCNISFLFPRYWDSIGFNIFFNSAQI